MKPGKLKKKVYVQTLTQAVDSYGSITETFTTAFTRRAKVRPVRGREPYIHDQRLPELDWVVELRHDSQTATITPKHQLVYGARTLEIDSVINVEEQDAEIRIYCREKV